MTALTFTLIKMPIFKLDCSRLTPNNLANLSLLEIKNLTLTGNTNPPIVSDFFEISGENPDDVYFKNTTNQLHSIGYKISQGLITIEGDCGDFLGAKMQGGTIICKGNAGDRVGDQMRRGLILVNGNAGDYCGSRLVAGTIGVYGCIGHYTGFAMKRGTILLTKTPKLHATIQDCGVHTLPFLALLFHSFTTLSTPFNTLKTQRVQRYAGDLGCNGNGEILILSH